MLIAIRISIQIVMKNFLKVLFSLSPRRKDPQNFVNLVVRLYSHGNVSLQNGEYITEKQLEQKRKIALHYNF